MNLRSELTQPQNIEFWRDLYRHEMNCQIVHDSLHSRPGWTQPYLLYVDEAVAGYGSILIGGPWRGTRTLFEFYVTPLHRTHLFELFEVFVEASGANQVEGQTNDPLFSLILHTFATDLATESLLFHDRQTTKHAPAGAIVRRAAAGDVTSLHEYELDTEARWVVDFGGQAVAAGDILFHYNRPYGDIYMKVVEPYRQRGFGSYLVQELKRICYEQGSVPAARCNPSNIASRKTLLRAGLMPCGFILKGNLSMDS